MPETKRYIGEILRRIARNEIDPRRAGLLLLRPPSNARVADITTTPNA